MIFRILRLGANEVRLTAKDRTSAIWMLIMPVAFILFFGSASSGGAREPSDTTISLGVVDSDVSWLSRALVETLEGEDFAVKEATGEEMMEEDPGRIRTLLIPAGFADAVARKEQVTLFLVTAPGARSEPNAVAALHVTRSLARLIGNLVEMRQVAGEAEPLGRQADRLQAYRALAGRKPLVAVETSYAGTGRPVPQGFGQAVPGMMTQFIIMMVLIIGTVYLTEEKVSGVLRRLAVAPFTPGSLMAGKLAGLVMLALLQAGVLIAAGTVIGSFRILGAEFFWGHSPLGLALVVTAFSFAAAGITLFAGALLSSPAQAHSVGWLLGMIMAGLGGCWWPLEIVPGWLHTAGHVFPTAWMMDALHDLISFGKGVDAVLPEAAVLLAYGLLFAFLGGRLLKVQA